MFLADPSHLHVYPSVHPAADVAVVDAEGAFFTQAHGADRRFRHTQRDQVLFNGLGALHTQDLVEAHRSLLIGVALEQDAPVPLAREEFRMALQGGLAFIGQSLAADFKVNIVVQDVGTSGCQRGSFHKRPWN